VHSVIHHCMGEVCVKMRNDERGLAGSENFSRLFA
jgi:hypothetical protein